MTIEEKLKARQADAAHGQYNNALQMALTDFQFIEECLRLYISVAYDFIRYQMKGKLPFHLNESDVEKDALGHLIDKYAKLSDNTAIVTELRKHVKERNEIAHRRLILTLEELRDVDFLDAQTKQLNDLHKALKPHINTLMNERAALTGEEPVNL